MQDESIVNTYGDEETLSSPRSTMTTSRQSVESNQTHCSSNQVPIEMKSTSTATTTTNFKPQDFEEVNQVNLFGSRIVALTINGRERLCLAQISNTLLKDFSYNEIHNRRVALGITCVQCTPIQLEMLRRAGAMPSSSRRCGMITRREAERLCRSFLVEEQPPELPENFYFTVAHRVNYGCKGRFVPARYISSRAKCIECFYCGEYYSPNKFIFHSHRQPHITDCNPPDSPNINSWRKHIDLDWTQEHSQDVRYAWEDVKSLFNGGTRRRASNPQLHPMSGGKSAPSPTNRTNNSNNNNNNNSNNNSGSTRSCAIASLADRQQDESDQVIDVVFDDHQDNSNFSEESGADISEDLKTGGAMVGRKSPVSHSRFPISSNPWSSSPSVPMSENTKTTHVRCHQPTKRSLAQVNGQTRHRGVSQTGNHKVQRLFEPTESTNGHAHQRFSNNHHMPAQTFSSCGQIGAPSSGSLALALNQPSQNSSQSILVEELLNSTDRLQSNKQQLIAGSHNRYQNATSATLSGASPTNNFIYNHLYTQLMQPHRLGVASGDQQQQTSSAFDVQMALRHHLWSSLLANLQCGTGGVAMTNNLTNNDNYNMQRQQQQQHLQSNLVAMQQQKCNQTNTMSNHETSSPMAVGSASNLSNLTGQLVHNLQASNANILQQQTQLGHGPDDLSSRFQISHRFSPTDTSSI